MPLPLLDRLWNLLAVEIRAHHVKISQSHTIFRDAFRHPMLLQSAPLLIYLVGQRYRKIEMVIENHLGNLYEPALSRLEQGQSRDKISDQTAGVTLREMLDPGIEVWMPHRTKTTIGLPGGMSDRMVLRMAFEMTEAIHERETTTD